MHQHDRLSDFFEEVKERCGFDYRFFSYYHDNPVLMRKWVLLYEQIVQVELPE